LGGKRAGKWGDKKRKGKKKKKRYRRKGKRGERRASLLIHISVYATGAGLTFVTARVYA